MRKKELIKLGLDIRAFIQKNFNDAWGIDTDTLEGACAIASYILYRALQKAGSNATFVEWSDGAGCHCWVEVRNNIIDLTATQFGDYDDVVIVPKSEYDVVRISAGQVKKGNKALDSLSKWSADQNPFSFKKQIKKYLDSL